MQLTGHSEKGCEHYDEIYSSGYNTAVYNLLFAQVLDMISKIENPHILEVGCGIGDLANMIIQRKIPYRGFDFSREAISQCHKRCPDGNFEIGNAYDDKRYSPCDYNLVIALEVLEHLDDYRVIETIPVGAELIASVPNYDDSAHLRLYKDPRKDIVERFAPYLKIEEIRSLTSKNPDSVFSKVIYLFRAIRVNPA